MKANELVKVLEQFKDSSYRKVLINGNWGIGKTKYISDFINGHSNACYVSLFGKRDVNSIIQEIYFHLIEKAPKGKMKKHFHILREKMNTLDISYFGISLSVPVIENIHRTLNKELSQKDKFIIVFDDLERKHNDLDIKEVFGVVDSLSKIENIKIVLVAATEQLVEDNKKTFDDYKEKAIDRIYKVEEYANEAPIQILGEQVWNVLRTYAEKFKFTNLRTFEKTNLFIKEVIEILGSDVFTEKFTRDDLYRMCFASVFFYIEHKGEMRLLDTEGANSTLRNVIYTVNDSGVIEYLCKYILNNSLDNQMNKNVFQHIKVWYETGAFTRDIIINLIDFINNYKEKPHNFFSSEQEILNIIANAKEYIRKLDGSVKIEDFILNLSTALTWCEELSVDFEISTEEILESVSGYIQDKIDITKNAYENEISMWNFHVESDKAKDVVKQINEKIKSEYYIQLLEHIKDSFNRRLFQEYSYLGKLLESMSLITQKNVRDNILKDIMNNNYLFPVPSGRITEQQWSWCHIIFKLIRDIQLIWGNANYFDDFIKYVYSLEITKTDKMLQFRLKQLMSRN